MTSAALADAIRDRARALGFPKTGFCCADLPPEASLYDKWLRAGMHGEMEWMKTTRDRRLDPERLLPGVRSLVVVAFPYTSPGSPRPDPGLFRGAVARYAAGRDYHEEVGERLRLLADFIESRSVGARALPCVDAAPVLERLFAAQAGLGWIGRNALVLDAELGSWFFLGVILTTAALPPGEPAADRCGSCRLCIDACPTGAIVPGRMVDSRRCLSYHTIELRGAIPEYARAELGSRVFGCDDCQEVCPWNNPQPQAGPPDDQAPALIDLLLMTHEDYLRRFQDSAIRRATWRGMRRNAAVALGNTLRGHGVQHHDQKDRAEAVAALRRIADDLREDPLVRDAARSAIGPARV